MTRTRRITAAVLGIALAGTTAVAVTAQASPGRMGQGNGPAASAGATPGAGMRGGGAGTGTPGAGMGTPTASTTPASAELAASLTFMKEEERLARDLYAALAAAHDDAVPFAQIGASEQRHMDAVGRLLDAYGLPDPSAGQDAGRFSDPALQAMYDRLLASGSTSLDAAYQAGIEVEKTDIADLQSKLGSSSDEQVRRVATNLGAASQRHLDAFTRAANGETVGVPRHDGTGPGAMQGRGWMGQGGMGDGSCDGTGRGVAARTGR